MSSTNDKVEVKLNNIDSIETKEKTFSLWTFVKKHLIHIIDEDDTTIKEFQNSIKKQATEFSSYVTHFDISNSNNSVKEAENVTEAVKNSAKENSVQSNISNAYFTADAKKHLNKEDITLNDYYYSLGHSFTNGSLLAIILPFIQKDWEYLERTIPNDAKRFKFIILNSFVIGASFGYFLFKLHENKNKKLCNNLGIEYLSEYSK